MKRSKWFVLGILVWCISATPLHAEESNQGNVLRDRTDEMMGRYNLHPVFEKLARGVGNLFLGFLEIPLAFHERFSERNTIDSTLSSIAIGTFKGAVRTGVGIYETITFLLPYPEHYAPILPTLDYADESKRKRLPLE